MTDDVLVQPVRTYLEGSVLKQPTDDPYPVGHWRARELKANGLVAYDDPEAVQVPLAADPAPEVPLPSKQRGRRPDAA